MEDFKTEEESDLYDSDKEKVDELKNDQIDEDEIKKFGGKLKIIQKYDNDPDLIALQQNSNRNFGTGITGGFHSLA